MKKIMLLLVVLLATSELIYASPFYFFDWGRESLVKIADFPQTPEFQNYKKPKEIKGAITPFVWNKSLADQGKHIDAGFRYKQVDFIFMPIWNYDVTWCGYVSEDQYIELTESEMKQYASLAGVKLPDSFPITFWEKYGAKILAFFFFLFWLLTRSGGKSETKASTPA